MRQKINKNIKDSNSDSEQVNLINIYRAPHFKYTKYTFLSTTSHLLIGLNETLIGSKSLLCKCKKTEIITKSLSDHSAIKLELRIKKLIQNCTAS